MAGEQDRRRGDQYRGSKRCGLCPNGQERVRPRPKFVNAGLGVIDFCTLHETDMPKQSSHVRCWGRAEVIADFQDDRFCEGFRMPAHEGVVPRTAGPASANLQGTKPREGIRWWCGVRYGDLSAASAVTDCWRRDCGSCARAKRCMNRRWLASNAVGVCPI